MNKNKNNTWDLEAILEGKPYEALEASYLKQQQVLTELYQADPFKDLAAFKKWCTQSEKYGILANRIWNYISNNSNADLGNNKFLSLSQQLQFKSLGFYQAMAGMNNHIIKSKTKIEEYLKDKTLAKYHRSYQNVFKTKKHLLSDEIQKYNSNFAQLSNSYSSIFGLILDKELTVPSVKDSKGKEHKIPNRAAFQKLLKMNDRVLRKRAYVSWYTTINNYRETFAKLLYYNYLEENVNALTQKFEGYIESVNFSDEIPNSFIPHVYKQVEGFKGLYEKYTKVRKEFICQKYKLDKYRPWDGSLSVGNNNEKVSIDEAKKLTLESLAVMGPDYVQNLKKAFNERWIDWDPRPNKRGGAYCIGGSKGLEKVYVLMNYNEKLGDVSTLVHELGHAMHAVEFNKHQDIYAENSILFAEIASICNEVLLNYHLLKKYKNNKAKQFQVYDELIKNFFATTTRQIIFSEFEWKSNELIKSGQPYNADVAEAIYHEAHQKYTKTNPKEKKLGSLQKASLTHILTVPHFYSGIFYVYKYSLGQIGALLSADRIYNQGEKAISQYYGFLRSGVSLSPLETIKLLGVDLEKEAAWNECKLVLEKWIGEYQKLAKDLTKAMKAKEDKANLKN